MPRRAVSRDLKARVPILHYEQGLSIKKICELLGIKKSLAYQTLVYSRTYGLHYNPYAYRSGRRRHLSATDVNFVYNILQRRHCSYLVEIQAELAVERGVSVSIPTLLRTLRHLHCSHKCVSVHALERNDLQCSAFMNRIADVAPDPEMLMFVDEAAQNKKTSGRKMGWSLVGTRCIQRRCFVCGQRYSILPILTLDGIITHNVIEGSVTTETFVMFLRELVVRVIHPLYHDVLTHSRYLLPIHNLGLKVSLFWTTAVYTMPRKSVYLSKKKLVH
jgi:transposase